MRTLQRWNGTMLRAALVGGTSPLVMTRVAAIVHSAIFDAVNGIAPQYTPIHVAPAAPAGASRRAAAVRAAYATLLQLYPTQKPFLDARLAVSLAILGAEEDSASIASGLTWGQTVADAILRGETRTASHRRRRPSLEERTQASGGPRRRHSRRARGHSSPT